MLALLMLLNISTSSHANIPSSSTRPPTTSTPAIITIAADAATGQGTAISRVDFYVDDALVGSAITAPYSIDWPATSGPHALVAKARDSISGITTSSVVNISVTIPLSAAPSISIAAPLDSTTIALPALIPVTFNVSVAVGKTISKIELYNQTNLLWGGSTTIFNWQPLAAGSYSLIAKVTDSDGNVGLSAPINVSLTGAASEIITWLHNDLGGNTIMATDSLGGTLWKENYTPFGDRVIKDATATSNNRQWFAGKPQDAETGLSYFGARYYDPAIGRFMGIDAARFSEGNLHSFNRYAYGNNNPYRFIDPDGNQAVENVLPKGAPIVTIGKSYGALAAYLTGVVTGNENLKNAALEGMAESRQGNIEVAIMLGTMGRARTTKVEPIKGAEGPHTTWKTDPQTGEITRHETWTPNSKNPTGWDSVQSTDLKGSPHVNKQTGDAVPTPHTQGNNIPGGVRPATPNEIPKNQ